MLEAHARYYEFIRDTAAASQDKGVTPLEAARAANLAELAALPDAERLVLNLRRAYAEAGGAEADVAASLGDA